MKRFSFFLILCIASAVCWAQNTQETISISGTVTDFEGRAIDSCLVQLMHPNFDVAYWTYSKKDGSYTLENVTKGTYMALYAIRPHEYPRQNKVAEEEMRLEFWAWNIIADRDLTIHPRYHKLELYGTHVYEVYGGYPQLFIYFRPMSLTKYLSYEKKREQIGDISVKPEHLQVKVYADEELLHVNSIQTIKEFEGEGKTEHTSYLLQTDVPKKKLTLPYIVIRVEAENTEHGEKGENIFFYKLRTSRFN